MKAGPNHRQAKKGLDLHETPPVAVHALLRKEQLPAVVWDPCCGPGAIVRELTASGRQAYGSDIDKRHGFKQLDFFRAKSCPAGTAICMNPPYALAVAMVDHALTMGVPLYVLLRLNWYAAVRPRYPHLYDRLARIHVFAPRLPLMHRDGWKGNKATSQFDFAWMVWETQPPMYGTTIDRVNWRKL